MQPYKPVYRPPLRLSGACCPARCGQRWQPMERCEQADRDVPAWARAGVRRVRGVRVCP